MEPQTTLLKESCRSGWVFWKINAAENAEESTPSTRDGHGENDEDEKSESRTSTFEKKRLAPPTSSLQALKKQKLLIMLSRT